MQKTYQTQLRMSQELARAVEQHRDEMQRDRKFDRVTTAEAIRDLLVKGLRAVEQGVG